MAKGENYEEGSPPPMRGKARKLTRSGNIGGITPAYAGKSSKGHSINLNIGDHPRLCGEKGLVHWKFGLVVGSPPPMRGKATH